MLGTEEATEPLVDECGAVSALLLLESNGLVLHLRLFLRAEHGL